MVPLAWEDSSGEFSFMPSAGAARARMMPVDTTVASTGRRWIMPAHRCAAGIFSERPAVAGWFRRQRSSLDRLARRVPENPSSAGSRVSEPTSTMATVAAAAIATPFSSGWRSTSRPIIPITTVVPAISTVRPAVRIATTAASSGARPVCRPSLNRVTTNSA
jgi:hypothetical protein